MSNKIAKLMEALQLNEERYNLQNENDVQDFVNFEQNVEDEIVPVIDGEADSEEAIKDTDFYIGQYVAICDICSNPSFLTKEQLNEPFMCPFCYSEAEGFKVIGKVASLDEKNEEPEELAQDLEDKGVEAEVIEEDLQKDERFIEVAQSRGFRLKRSNGRQHIFLFDGDDKEAIEQTIEVDNAVKGYGNASYDNGEMTLTFLAESKKPLKENSKLKNYDNEDLIKYIIRNFKRITGKSIESIFNKPDQERPELPIFNQDEIDKTIPSIKGLLKDKAAKTDREIDDFVYELDDALIQYFEWNLRESKELKEESEVNIKVDGKNIEVETADNGDFKVAVVNDGEEIVKLDDVPEENLEDEEAAIVPLSDEEQEEVETLKDITDELDDAYQFESKHMGTLVTKFLREHFEDVRGFKLEKASQKGLKLVLEGKTIFKNGKEKKTDFKFENYKKRVGKQTLIGECSLFGKGSRGFKLETIVENKIMKPHTLRFNFNQMLENKSYQFVGFVKLNG